VSIAFILLFVLGFVNSVFLDFGWTIPGRICGPDAPLQPSLFVILLGPWPYYMPFCGTTFIPTTDMAFPLAILHTSVLIAAPVVSIRRRMVVFTAALLIWLLEGCSFLFLLGGT
jgi:hypothetical protein